MPRELEGQPGQTIGPMAIVVARYNDSITSNLLQGALETLREHQIPDDAISIAWVPGAWEVPVAAEQFAASGDYLAVICLAAVIRGETSHDQYINQQVSHSLGQIALRTGVPALFGVLTCNSLEQAINRSGGKVGNKGNECALAALEMADLIRRMSEDAAKSSSN